MKKIILHIGLHKTGSTYLQNEYFPGYENICYLTRPFTQYNHVFNKLQYADDAVYNIEETRNMFRSLTANKVLISDENWSGKAMGYSYINRSFIAKRLAQALTDYDAHIVIFIRGQKSMLASLYNQAVKGHLRISRPIDEFFWYPKKNFDLDQFMSLGNGEETMALDHLYYNTNKYYVHLDSFLYHELIQLYKSHFENVHVFPYEKLRDNPKEVLEELDNIIGEKNSSTASTAKTRINPSIPNKNLYNKTLQNRYHTCVSRLPFGYRAVNLFSAISRKRKRNFMNRYHSFLNEIPSFYSENNRKVIRDFPSADLQNYPNEYATGS